MQCTPLINACHAELHSLCGLELLPIHMFSYFCRQHSNEMKRFEVGPIGDVSARVYVRRNTHCIVSDGKILIKKELVCHTVRTGRSGGLNPDRGKIFSSSLQRSERLWFPPDILCIGFWVPFPEVKREVDCFHLRSLSRIRINGVV